MNRLGSNKLSRENLQLTVTYADTRLVVGCRCGVGGVGGGGVKGKKINDE